jgi:hypothetical protein
MSITYENKAINPGGLVQPDCFRDEALSEDLVFKPLPPITGLLPDWYYPPGFTAPSGWCKQNKMWPTLIPITGDLPEFLHQYYFSNLPYGT